MDRTRIELFAKSTSAEKAVCRILDRMRINYIRQYPVRTPRKAFYVDIYIPALNLAIEVDGRYHYTDRQRRLDANRSACIRRKGMHVYRIDNKDARATEKVLALIQRRERQTRDYTVWSESLLEESYK